MTAKFLKKQKSKSLIVEHGEFERVVVRDGDKRNIKTVREKIFDRPNPAKLTIAKGGDWEVFSYPYPSPEYVYLRVGRGKRCGIEVFEATTAYREFAKISARLARYRLRLAKGVRRRNVSGCSLIRAYEYGLRAFLRSQSRNESHIYMTNRRKKKKLTRVETIEREYRRSRGL